MEKFNSVLVVTNKNFLEDTVKNLNFDLVNLNAIFMDGGEKFFVSGEKKIPIISFAQIHAQVKKYKSFVWLVGDCANDSDFRKVKKFLVTLGIDKNNIVDFGASKKISQTWLANFNHVKEHGADFFATGDEYIRDGLNLKFIPCAYEEKNKALGGVNLADVNQDLQQSYFIAKNIFESVKPGTIKFVFIGLSPDSFRRDNSENIFDFKYLPCLAKNDGEADLNFDAIKKDLNREFSAKSVIEWEEDKKILPTDSEEKNFQILKDYIELCKANKAKAIGVIFPFAPAGRKTYDEKVLSSFREKIHELEKDGEFFCVDMFELNLNYDCFCDMTHLNLKGSRFANAMLSMKLYQNNCLPIESFCDMTYEYLNTLAFIADKDEYNNFVEKIFSVSAKKIRRKDKIKIGFVVRDASQWCGDDLYNLFAKDNRFEVTILSYLRLRQAALSELVNKDFWRGIEQFKQRNLNIVALDNLKARVPNQDILIFLTAYFSESPKLLRPENLTLKTLMTHIPYSFDIAIRGKGYYNRLIFHTAWKIFFSSDLGKEVYAKNNRIGMPRGYANGYPRMDIFFVQNSNFHFDWKMTRPNAKKIIYAPHWSINAVTRYATFQWNHQFMYEFAKNHPEISWIIKPHPALPTSSVKEKIFSSAKEYEEYLQKWNDLPNAQVYTGAYYQALFATSDGMIHDSGSFIAEYQFVNKPMIFLTREGEKFNALGEEILKASYLVDGKDLKAIAAMMQKVFIEGNDYKAPQRREVYKKYLDYPNYTGMLASEFIYQSIVDGLEGK